MALSFRFTNLGFQNAICTIFFTQSKSYNKESGDFLKAISHPQSSRYSFA